MIPDVAHRVAIVATITRPSVADLGLAPGRDAIALLASGFVILARAHNALAGTVPRREQGTVASKITLAHNTGKTIAATPARDNAGAAPSVAAVAPFKASHVILAVG